MQVSLYFPTFDVSVDAASKKVIGQDPATGFLAEGNFGDVAIAAADGFLIQPHTTHVVRRQLELAPCFAARNHELKRVRFTGPAPKLEGKPDVIPTNSCNDWHDDMKNPHGTSGARRWGISVAYELHERGLPVGLEALRSWAKDQELRPVCWWPFEFTYDAYRGVLTGNRWTYDSRMTNGAKDPNGWGIVDAAHVETSNLFAGVAIGDEECLWHLFWLASWDLSTWAAGGPKTGGRVMRGWTGSNQERARGLRVKAATRYALAGLGIGSKCQQARDTFFAGQDPKQHLLGFLRDSLARPQAFGANAPDDRTMVDFRDGSGEIKAVYPWQCGLMFDGYGYALSSGLVADKVLADQVMAWMRDRAELVCSLAVGPGGVAYSVAANRHFTQSSTLPLADPRNQSVDKANQLETDKSHRYVLDDDDGDGFGSIVEVPRVPDSELLAMGVFGLYGLDHPTIEHVLGVNPKPDQVQAYTPKARYLDPIYAALEQATG